jgi:NADPH:quinone reductase
MRAVVVERFGGPEVLQVRQMPVPRPGRDEVLVAIHAAGTNPVDSGNRADGTWAGMLPPFIPGSDASGVVEAVGEGVKHLSPGDEVFSMSDFIGNPDGTYAEYQAVDAEIVARKPHGLSHVEAAAVPLAAGTAYEVVARRLALEADEWVLLHGAAGGVGSYAVQIAAARGARVIASASSPRHEKLKELGATICIDYRTEDVPSAARKAAGVDLDAVADFVGGDCIARSLGVLRPFGRAAAIASLRGELELLMDRNITLHGVLVRPDRARLEELRGMLESGALHPVIDEVLPLEQAAKAHVRLDAGHGQGKVVLAVR